MSGSLLHTSKLALLSLLMAVILVIAVILAVGKQVTSWAFTKLYDFFYSP